MTMIPIHPKSPSPRLALALLTLILSAAAATMAFAPRADSTQESRASHEITQVKTQQKPMQIEYLEIVTPDVDDTCSVLEKAHGVSFSEPVPEMGNARTAELAGGGRIGVRWPLRDDEHPVIRPYVLVEDIEAAVQAAEDGGAVIAHPPMEIPGGGTFAIYILGGIEHGLWQN